MKILKVSLVPACIALTALSACNSDSSNPPSVSSNPGNQTAPTPQQQIAANFTVSKDDGSWLHNHAFRDASGVLWAETVVSLANPQSIKDTQSEKNDMEEACNESGATLPTIDQLNQLAKYLGRDTSIGFHP
jgi:hypothetical protein